MSAATLNVGGSVFVVGAETIAQLPLLGQAVRDGGGGTVYVDSTPQVFMGLVGFLRTGTLPHGVTADAVASVAAQYGADELAARCRSLQHLPEAIPLPVSQPAPVQQQIGIPVAVHPPVHPDARFTPQQGQYVPEYHNQGHYVPQYHTVLPEYIPGASAEWLAKQRGPPPTFHPDEMEASKMGVSLQGCLRFSTPPNLITTRTLLLKNESNHGDVVLTGIVVARTLGGGTFHAQDASGVSQRANVMVVLPPGASYPVTVSFMATALGRSASWIMFSIYTPSCCFRVGQEGIADVRHSSLDVDAVPYRPIALRALFDTEPVQTFPSVPPPIAPSWRAADRVATYTLPDVYRHLPSYGPELVDGPLTDASQTASWWHTLLWLEEAAAVRDMGLFDLSGVQAHTCPMPQQQLMSNLRPSGRAICCVRINVPGLPERRPHLCVGDALKLRPTKNAGQEFQGYVYTVEATAKPPHVVVGVNSALAGPAFSGAGHTVPEFHVRFFVRRNRLRRCHAAVDAVQQGEGPVLPPLRSGLRPQAALPPSVMGDSRPALPSDEVAGLNIEQQHGVGEIVRRGYGLQPFLVYGPPGTGKTRVVIAAARLVVE
eukprot:Hpha_TRINITY_DN10257_c0_g3::TRINITY_DN10257_c0_g3_i2::g.35215::m.35215/K18422/MOV10; helicase MOV-10